MTTVNRLLLYKHNRRTYMKVATYARVSTGRQELEETIKSQMMAIEDKIAKEGHTIVQKYFDDGWTGMILARPGLDQLRLDANSDNWDGVVVYDPDRLARKNSYIQLLVDEIASHRKSVLYVTMGEVKNDEDRLMLNVKGSFGEYERAKIVERFRLGKLRKARDGHVVTSSAPYGYTYICRNDHGEGHYEIEPQEARLVKKIFEWVANEGLTIRKVVKRLQELDIKPRKSKRGVWNSSTITNMLRNESYIGHAHYLKSEGIIPKNPIKDLKYKRVIKTSRRTRDRSEWINIEVPAIIEEQLFWKVRRQLETNYAVCKRNRKNDYLLAGKIYCECGRKRNGEGRQENNHLYYRCTDRVYSYPNPPTCRGGGINAVVADALVWRGIADFMSDSDLIKRQLNRYFQKFEQNKLVVPVASDQIKKEIATLSKKEKKYLELYVDDRISKDVLDKSMQELVEKKHVLERELASIPEELTAVRPSDQDIESFVQRTKETIGNLNFQTKRGILLKLIDKVVGDQNSLTVTGSLPLGEQFSGYLDHRNVVYGSISRNCRFTKCGQEYTL
ncbi:MAG: hypothetical protein DPW11_00580 [bacterium]|nr:hypothetical protein [bacterium]